ncbi:ENL protein, partial [Atractosteus spatula]|nr:ENL protein [Atractosteus spatula]
LAPQCTVQVKLELGHRAQLRKKPTPEGFTHDWMVFVRGPEMCDIQHFVEKVVFRLHESFPKPKRVCKEPPYKVEESGYAGFLMPIEVYFRNKEEPKKVFFNYDLFLNLEGNPPVNHLRCEKLTFNNPTKEFRRKLLRAGGVMVVPEGAETISRPSPDYPMLPTIPLSAFSDPKKTKPSHGSKVSGRGRLGQKHIALSLGVTDVSIIIRPFVFKMSKKVCESLSIEGAITFFGLNCRGVSSDSLKCRPDIVAAGNVCLLDKSLSPHPGDPGGRWKRYKVTYCEEICIKGRLLGEVEKKGATEGPKGSGSFTGTSPRVSSSSVSAPASGYPDKKPKEKGRWGKPKPDAAEVKEAKKPAESEESNSEDEASSKSESVASSPSNSSSSSESSSESDFEPSQNHSQGPLRSMVEDLQSEESDDDDSSSEEDTPVKTNPPNRDPRLSLDSESDSSDDREPPPPPQKHSTSNNKVSGRKSPDTCSRPEKILKKGYDKAYTEELVDLHRRLMALRERNVLQQIVNLIEETGHFNVTNTTFDFDLFSLDESTVRKLQSYLEATAT